MDWYLNVSRNRDQLFIRGIKNGKEIMRKLRYEPTLYVKHHKDIDYGFENVYGEKLKPIHFPTMADATGFATEHKDSNLTVYGFPGYQSQYVLENYSDTVDKFDRDQIRVFNIDIEVTSDQGFPNATDAEFPVTAICIHDSITDKFVTFGLGKWAKQESILENELISKVIYIECENEHQLLSKFLRFWTDSFPNVITGWNVESFDMPYLLNRLHTLGFDQRKLSPWQRTEIRMIQTTYGETPFADIQGIDILDYMQLYRKNKVQESYRLDHISFVELGQKKLDYSEVSGLHQLYFKNFQKFIDYNIQDVNLVRRLDEKMGLINAQIMVAYTACINFQEVGSPVRTWDALINSELWRENKVGHFNINASAHDGGGIPGGHVKEPQVGKHGWCLSFDLNSLYPHLIMQWNVSPETLHKSFRLLPHSSNEERITKLLNKEHIDIPDGYCVSGSGYAFNTEFEGVIPRIMRKLYQERKQTKKLMIQKQQRGEDSSLENLRQYVLKIVLNSGYGALTNKYYRWYDKRLGESITLSGQYIIQTAEREINMWMNKVLKTDKIDYIVAIDTDSNYVNFQPLVDKFFSDKSKDEIVDILDKIAVEQVQKVLDVGFKNVQDYTKTRSQEMVMEREAIASSAFWTAKKRYAMCVWDMEGVRMPEHSPKIKIQGLEAIRSSIPQTCRTALLDIIKLILMSDEKSVQDFIADFRVKYKELPFQEIAFPRTINNITKRTIENGFQKGTPPHVRGAIQFNRLVKHLNIEKDWETMKDGEKGKFVWLRVPNNVGSDVISFSTTLPPEFKCEQYINYDKMFEKSLLEPVNGLLDPVGWQAEKTISLLDFI